MQRKTIFPDTQLILKPDTGTGYPATLNLDPDPGFWHNLDPDPDPVQYYQFWKKKFLIILEKFFLLKKEYFFKL